MRYREFENHIQESFEGDEVAIDLVALQSSLQSKLEKKRRFPFIWMLGSTVGIGALAMLYLLGSPQSASHAITDATSVDNYSNITKTNSINANNSSQQELSIQVNNDKSHTSLSSSSLANPTIISTSDDASNMQTTFAKLNNTSLNNTSLNNTKTQLSSEVNNNQVPNLTNDTKKEVNSNTNNQIIEGKSLDQNLVNFSNDSEANNKPQSSILNVENDESIAISSSPEIKAIDNNNATASSSRKENFAISLLPMLDLSTINSLHPFTLKGKEILCPTFDRKSNLLISFMPEVGYFIPIKRLSSKQPDFPNGVFALRYDNEESLEGISAGAHLKIGKSDLPFYVKGGVVMNRITEKMKLSYTTIKRDTTIGIVSITKSPNGDTITTIYGPIVKETETTGVNTKHYYLHLFDVPVSIGVEQKLGNLKLCAEVGAAFNVGLSTSGNILTTDDNYEDVKQGGKFRSSIGLNYFGSIGVEMPMTEKISLYGNLRGRYLPTDFTRADGTISQRYNTLGVNVGVVYSIK